MNRRLRTLVTGLVAAVAVPALVFGSSAAWAADPVSPPTLPDEVTSDGGDWTPPEPRGLADSLKRASGTVEVTVRLAEPTIAETVPEGAVAEGTVPGKADQKAKKDKVTAQQDEFVTEASDLGATELGRTDLAANLVAVSADAGQLEEIAALPNVISVTPIRTYETHATTQDDAVQSGSLAQAIDYVQARPLHEAGFDGTGVKVAVLDSGIDFTHFNLGGPGDQAVTDECFAGAAAAVAGVCATLFGDSAPKVKGGYDFVGETWPTGARLEDPNPIDAGSDAGHGSHVADIIGGRSADGTHLGIAPGVDLYAVKVCSAVSTSCNGVAMLLGMDWALDPNGDGDISDAVDVVNMSLGSSYGQEQDDSSLAANNLVNAGVVVVVSAGNSADRPFIVGSPSTAPGVISVAQTSLPDDLQWVIQPDAGPTITNAVLQSWSPAPTAPITSALARPAGILGCSPADFAGFPAGAVALVSRGSCNVSDKAVFAQGGGAVAVIIYNNAPGDPPSFSFGSTVPVTVPTFSISQADGNALIASGATSVTIDPAQAISLTNTMVGTSSRGTTVGDHRAKPDIGAPGAWLSAETGTATEETNFGGTSGAAPVVSGAAALLLDKFEGATPAVIKARLLNGADSSNRTPTADGFITTPISRIGAGEVRVAPSADAVGVLAVPGVGGNIGLGIPSVTKTYSTDVELTLSNTSDANRKYSLTASYREEADQASGAVSIKIAPNTVVVPKGKTQKIKVQVTIDGSKLADWPFNSVGATGGTGSLLNGPEFDGWITATSDSESVKLGWTVLPKKAADVSTSSSLKLKNGAGTLKLKNGSFVAAGPTEIFALTGTSPELPDPAPGEPGSPGSNAAIIDLAAVGVRQPAVDVLQFAIATYDRRTVLNYPAEFDVYIDSNNDGTDDYVLYNAEVGGFAVTGQTAVYVANLSTGASTAYFYVDGGFNSATQIFTAPLAALGIAQGQTFGYSVYAFDNYFTGAATDAIEGQSFTAGASKYTPSSGAVTVPAKSGMTVNVQATGSTATSTQTGLLLTYRSAATTDFAVVQIPQ
ncbi:PA domain-containing protein [Microbacterium sp. cf046]|uniref:S8 family serine peptidase n=1 Tax=Microbacterium sp. cf046 TaxID=1761803 RepID=UPI0008E3B928|nr:S8 family serine peptidase [Microbacterium sp. cf046]SFR93660.1 PA domain-containing protein [Microbacterium sp. cf046]